MNEPVVDEIDLRERTCKNCAPNILLADPHYARATTVHLTAEYGRNPRDAIPVPETLTARLPRKLPVKEYHGRPDNALSPFHSPAPSSSQETGVVYTEDKEKYLNTVGDNPTNWPLVYDLAQRRFDLEYDDTARNLYRNVFEKKKETLRWIEGVQKKPT